jgi:hypothetical protein
MSLATAYIITANALAITQSLLPSLTMFLASSFSALCSLLALLGTAGAQSSSPDSYSLRPSAGSVVGSLSSKFPPLSPYPSPTSSGFSLTSPPAATNGFSTLGDVLKPTITPYTFVPFPTPSQSSIPGVFPETWPENPPPVGDPTIPDFGPAWEDAYTKAREMVSGHWTPLLVPCNSHPSAITDSGFDA